MRKVVTFVLAVVLVMAMAVPAMATAVGSPTAPVAAPDKTTSLPEVTKQDDNSLIVPIEEADTLSDAAKETFSTAQKELMDEEKQKEIIPEGMATQYFFYYVPAESAQTSAVTMKIDELDADAQTDASTYIVVKQFQDGKWVELKVTVNADGTVTIEGLGEGPVAVFVKKAA